MQRCESLIKDLNHIITTSIIRQCNGTPRIRRRNWLKNKRQVVQLYEKLEKERKILWEAHCAELLSVPYIYSLPDEILTRHSRSSTRRVELTTDTIKNQSIRHDSKVLSIDKRLGSMEAALSSRQSTKPYNADSSLPSSIFGRHDGFDVQSLSETAMSGHPDDWRDNIVSKEEEPTRNPLFDAFHFADVCPELYTVRTGVPNLVQAYGGDTSVSQYMRVYQFCILLLPTTSQMDSIHLTPHYKRRVQILESTTVNGHRSDQPPLSRATTQLNGELLKRFPTMEEDLDDNARNILSQTSRPPKIRQADHNTNTNNSNSNSDGENWPTRTGFSRPEECLLDWREIIHCNRCNDKATHHFHHCRICDISNCDICYGCFLEGVHCFDVTHALEEYSNLSS